MAESGPSPEGATPGEGRAPAPGDDDLLATLQRAVHDVFSAMICRFERTAVYPEGLPDSAVRAHRLGGREARCEFDGAFAGALALRCSPEGERDIASGLLMLADTPGLSAEGIDDAIRECVNMLSGFVKSHAFDPRGRCTLTVPVMADVASEPGASAGAVVFRLDHGEIAIEIRRREERAARAA